MSDDLEVVEGELCPYCHNKTLTLMERVVEIPFFGIAHIFSMDCSNCDYSFSDIESEEDRGKVKYSFDIESEDDLKVRVVKSSACTVKIPRFVEIKPGSASQGYITNVEGVLNRFKRVLEELKEDDDKTVAKKAKTKLKRLQRILWGQEKATLVLEDPTGNSAIISDKAIRS